MDYMWMHSGEIFKCSMVPREYGENNQKNNSKVSIFAWVLEDESWKRTEHKIRKERGRDAVQAV